MTEPEAAGQTPATTRRRRLGLGAVGLLLLASTAFVAFRYGAGSADSAAPVSTASASPSATALTAAEVYAALKPSVVTIEATVPGSAEVRSSGTGVVASAEGVILTARHVVVGDGALRVTFADGTQALATVAAEDASIDIALLTVDALPGVLVPAKLGNSGRLAIGHEVVAIGNPFGLTGSTTSGVVSGLDRAAGGTDGSRLEGLIQFDAAVNPGNSGGPLVNMRGETIGIVVALANPTGAGTFIGIGFAVPIGSALGAGGEGPGGRGPEQ
jgi:putative serine protease PepD